MDKNLESETVFNAVLCCTIEYWSSCHKCYRFDIVDSRHPWNYWYSLNIFNKTSKLGLSILAISLYKLVCKSSVKIINPLCVEWGWPPEWSWDSPSYPVLHTGYQLSELQTHFGNWLATETNVELAAAADNTAIKS